VNLINFERIYKEDLTDLISEVINNESLYNYISLRTQSKESPHREVDDILLRGPKINSDSTPHQLWNEVHCVNYNAFDVFPIVYQHVLDVMRVVDGVELGRVIITKLPSNGKIYPHFDGGDAGEAYTRYHTVLKGVIGNKFTSGEDTVHMVTGETWWVNNHITHSVHNDTNEDRIHLIMDILI